MSREPKLPPALAAKLASVPERKDGHPRKSWTEEQDFLLLAGWKTKSQRYLARLVDHDVRVCKNRYEELTKGGKT